jgi:cell division protein FtsX
LGVDKKREFDAIGFALHFLLGALPGAGFGFYAWAKLYDRRTGTFDSAFEGLLFVIGGAILFGLVAGWLRDKLWTR